MFEYSFDNKRYHTLHYHLMNKFGEKVYKAVINAGFTCPNIDGRCGVGGCAYCYDGAGEFTHGALLSITEQLETERERISKKCADPKLIAYFQAHTNTYAPLEILEKKYNEALAFPNVVGISIATRPDCIDEDIAGLISDFSRKTYLTVELGLQTIHDESAHLFNRGYDYETFLDAYRLLKTKGVRVCVHMINGLQGESYEEMIETAKTVGALRPDAVKIHLLHVVKGTRYENLYNTGEIQTLSKDEYIDIVCSQLRFIPSETVVERITGDGGRDTLVAPKWSLDKISVLGGIDKAMTERDIYQGDMLKHKRM